MKTIHLQVQEDYLEEFLSALPYDKVKLLSQDFLDVQNKFQKELENFKNSTGEFLPYYDNMKTIDAWINEGAGK